MRTYVQKLVMLALLLTLVACSDNNDNTEPSLILNVSPVASSADALVRWNSIEEVVGYDICYATETIPAADIANCTSYTDGQWTGQLAATVTEHTLTSLTLGSTYYLHIVGKDAEGNIVSTSNEVSAVIATTTITLLNDTGITQCGNADSNIQACPQNGYVNQDAEHGRDVTHNDDTDGHAGFSFTKISSTGAELANDATQWSCVKDNVTGLIWEVKIAADDLHGKNDEYFWYEPDNSKNGGDAGNQGADEAICFGYDAADEASFCNTHAYVQRVNAQGLCGANDWRLPVREALHSIISYDRNNLSIDTDWFEPAAGNLLESSHDNWFWSSSTYALQNIHAWGISFNYGRVVATHKNSHHPVRLVRSGQ